MVLFKKWFRNKILLRFYVLLLISTSFVILLWIRLEEKKSQSFENKLDYIASIVDQSIQRSDRTLLENIAYYTLKDTQSKSFYVCIDNQLAYSISNDFFDCSNIQNKRSYLTKSFIKFLKSGENSKLILVADRTPFIIEALIIFIFVCIFIFYIFNQLNLINHKINSDILLPLSDVNSSIKSTIIEVNEAVTQKKKNIAIEILESQMRQAKQFAHDIRSPLSALKVVNELAINMDKDQAKLLKMSIDRITDIANTILPKPNQTNQELSTTESSFIWMLLDQIVSEKRVEYKNKNNVSIQFQVIGSPFIMNAICNPIDFMRSVSNIINNSVEAKLPNRSIEIQLILKNDDAYIILSIEDNGKGIDPSIISEVFNESFTHGKQRGTGLGLYQVKNSIESWGGNIQIESQVGLGTKLNLMLKKSEKPKWIADPIKISTYNDIVVLDDEEYVFKIIKEKLELYNLNVQYFKNIIDLESNLKNHSKIFYFIDQDLKQNITGLNLIQKLKIQKSSILLTGNYDDKYVQQQAIQTGVTILPKPLLHEIQIS